MRGLLRAFLTTTLILSPATLAVADDTPTGAAPAAAPPASAPDVSTPLGDVVRLLVGKEYVAQVDADALAATEKTDPSRAVVDLARVLVARGHLTTAAADAVAALAASPGGGASSRAIQELLRVLLETQNLSEAELDSLQVPDGVRRIVWVPELVRAQIREQVKRDLLEQMQKEGWAAPKAFPEWARRLTFSGDVRSRFERLTFGKRNANGGQFVDFNAVNGGSPADVKRTDLSGDRYLDVDQGRSRTRLRARFGIDAEVTRRVTASLRLASGDGAAPVSTNQTLGGSAGNFSKYQLWLDRAGLKWNLLVGDERRVAIEVGRFANPFYSTDLVWDEDVNLDGLAVEAVPVTLGSTRTFATLGVFPVYNTALAFPPESAHKFKSRDRWLWAAQLGGDYRPEGRLQVKLAAAYYLYQNIEGKASSPCDTNVKGVSCDTDNTRPAFAQNGNTYFPLRTPSDAAALAEINSPSTTPRYEYFGLASKFRVLVVTVGGELQLGESMKVGLEAELARNTAFRKGHTGAVAVNNLKGCGDTDVECAYRGGDTGLLGRLSVGSRSTQRRGDWSASVAYRYLESDAVVDAFTDSDFGLGGTNLKGYVLGLSLCPLDNVALGLRFYSARQIVGPPYAENTFQFDLGARY